MLRSLLLLSLSAVFAALGGFDLPSESDLVFVLSSTALCARLGVVGVGATDFLLGVGVFDDGPGAVLAPTLLVEPTVAGVRCPEVAVDLVCDFSDLLADFWPDLMAGKPDDEMVVAADEALLLPRLTGCCTCLDCCCGCCWSVLAMLDAGVTLVDVAGVPMVVLVVNRSASCAGGGGVPSLACDDGLRGLALVDWSTAN